MRPGCPPFHSHKLVLLTSALPCGTQLPASVQPVQVPEGPKTEATLRNNINVCILYMVSGQRLAWLLCAGNSSICVQPVHREGRMEWAGR